VPLIGLRNGRSDPKTAISIIVDRTLSSRGKVWIVDKSGRYIYMIAKNSRKCNAT